jgi:hypothetical protein
VATILRSNDSATPGLFDRIAIRRGCGDDPTLGLGRTFNRLFQVTGRKP